MKYLVTALLLFGHLASPAVLACFANPVPEDLQQVSRSYTSYRYVFVADVAAVSRVSRGEELYSLRIGETFKGDLAANEVARNHVGMTCSFPLALNQRYLFFVQRAASGELQISGAVVQADRATEFIPALRDLKAADLQSRGSQ